MRLRRGSASGRSSVDLGVQVGSVGLRSPILTAAGTSGHGAELGSYVDLARLGAVVTKSVSAEAWGGNPAPRVVGTDAGMLNSVGLQNPGVQAWLEHDLPALRGAGATVVASIWGFTLEAYAAVAAALRGVEGIAAVEVNVSCPNIEDRRHMFAHSPLGTAGVVGAVRGALGADVALWAKLSPNVTALGEIVDAAVEGGADAVTLINTVMGMVIDTESRRPALGAGGGGLSGPAIRPVAVRAIYEMRRDHPDLPIVGAGGVAKGVHAVELLMAGADAVQVGTATFYDPRSPQRIADELASWCAAHGVHAVSDLVGAAHR